MSQEVVLKIENICKRFPGVKALDNVNFELRKGEIHACLGENGAGKSTLMKIIIGLLQPEEGQIIFENKSYSKLSIGESAELGIRMVHQELMLVPEMTVAENIYFGNYPKQGAFLDRATMVKKAGELLASFGNDINPMSKISELSIAHRQIVEIAKALSQNVKVLILDEPTTSLSNDEVVRFFDIVKSLKDRGVSVVFISHRMEELFQLCDRITILRDGTYVDTKVIKETSKDELIKLMVGRELNNLFPSITVETGEEILRIENVCNNKLKDVSLNVKAGEIVGIGGLVGAGRTEVLRAIYGADRISDGKIYFENKYVNILEPSDGIKTGIVLIPEDRKKEGAFLHLSVKDNIVFSTMNKFKKSGILKADLIRETSLKMIEKLGVKTPNEMQNVVYLSGGNQQKVIIAKCLLTDAKIFLFDEPTRGIDVGAKYEIYLLMNEIKNSGKAVIMVSSEMEELIGMSDRTYVMCEGHITGELRKEEMNQESIMKLASNTH